MIKLTWIDVLNRVMDMGRRLCKLRERFPELHYVYGVPRGGQTIAAVLSQMNPVWTLVIDAEKIDPKTTVIVDDIIDSGDTLDPFIVKGFSCDVLYRSQTCLVHDRELSATASPYPADGWVEFPWEQGETGPEDAVTRLLQWIGEDPKREGLIETPKRVTKAFKEMTVGYAQDPKAVLAKAFESDGYDEMIVETPIEFTSLCEHHMLPFTGTCAIGYLPKGRVVGASKLARLVEVFSRRLQIQERMTAQIANMLNDTLDCTGVGVIVKAKHSCMGCRGVMQRRSSFITSTMLGVFRESPAARSEFLTLVGSSLD